MVFSQMIQEALDFALETHWANDRQMRKGKDVPYIVHPLTVALILARAGADEEVVAAGLLHDTVEDSSADHPVTIEDLRVRFGERVAALVESVTEDDKNVPWPERKEIVLRHVKAISDSSVLLKSADVIANDSELLADFSRDGDKVFERFKVDCRQLIQYKLRLNEALVNRWPESPLAADLLNIGGNLRALDCNRPASC